MGLKSNRFWLGVLTLERRDDRIVYGRATTLDAIARGLAKMRLQSLPHGASSWSDVSPVSGDVDITLRPRTTTAYRLKSRPAAGSALSVLVAAKIVFAVQQPPGGLKGIVRPKSLAGQSVTVQRKRDNGSWSTVATTTVNADGTFRANFEVTSGTYRARISPPASSGLLAGTSGTLNVS